MIHEWLILHISGGQRLWLAQYTEEDRAPLPVSRFGIIFIKLTRIVQVIHEALTVNNSIETPNQNKKLHAKSVYNLLPTQV